MSFFTKLLPLPLLLLSVSAVIAPERASAGVLITLVGGGDRTISDNTVRYGGGMLAGFHLIGRFSLEAGGLYFHNKTVDTPAFINLHLTPMLSISGGGFYDYSMVSKTGTDYGWRAGARLRWQRYFVDGVYTRGMKDLNGTKSSGVMALFGIHLGFL